MNGSSASGPMLSSRLAACQRSTIPWLNGSSVSEDEVVVMTLGVRFLRERGGRASRFGVHEHQPAYTDMRPQGGLITTRRMANRVQLLRCRAAPATALAVAAK